MDFVYVWLGFLALLFVGLVIACVLHDKDGRKGGEQHGNSRHR